MKQLAARVSACIIIVASLSATGCQFPGDADEIEVEIRTDVNSYIADSSTTIVLSVSNESEDPVYYICTGQIYLEELDDGQVNSSWMVHGFEKCLRPVAIEPSETRTFELPFGYGSALGQIEDAGFDESVRYRFRMELFKDNQFDQLLDRQDRLSNRFKIVQ